LTGHGIAAIGLPALASLPASAETVCLPAISGPAVLEVRGLIGHRNQGDSALFDDDMLGMLQQTAFTTSTIWTPGPTRFSGPTLRGVLECVKAEGDLLIAEAANNYRVIFDPSDIEADSPIIARRIDDKPFGLRERGPLWIVFPYDRDPRYRTEKTFGQSIWQLVSLTVTKA